jgi:tyrosyl-tRNA synthetase
MKIDEQKIEEVLSRGVEDIIVKDELKKRLMSGKKFRLYLGVDPTGFDLHLGHAIALWKLRAFQELGHEVILLIGDFTARIGDPSGKDITRKPLSEKEVKANMKDYKKQASKILDFSKVKIKYNSQWLSKLRFEDILKLSGNFTVQQMIQRDMFQRRLKEDMPISVQEFMYPLMQGYDSVAMDVDLEVGGNDQMFNMLAGRTLQKKYNNKDKNVMTLKLLMGTDGRKMSKTFNNFIALNDQPKEMYGKVMSIKDELIGEYFKLATRISFEEIKNIEKISNPRDQKARLAFEIVKLYYGEKEAQKAEQEFDKIFKNKELPTEIENFDIELPKDIVYLLVDTKIASSKKEAWRLVNQRGVKFNSKIIDNPKMEIFEEGILQVGSRRFAKINFKK